MRSRAQVRGSVQVLGGSEVRACGSVKGRKIDCARCMREVVRARSVPKRQGGSGGV